MAKLPEVPSLDPNGGLPSAPTRGVSGPLPVPVTASPPVASPSPLPAVPLPGVGAGGSSPSGQSPGVPGEPAGFDLDIDMDEPPRPLTGSAPNDIDESVEEMLSQTSEQTLVLVRLEEAVAQLTQTVADLREEMHAGFIELRGALHERPSPDPGAVSPPSARLDAIEEATYTSARDLKGRLGLIIGVQVALAVLVVAMVWLARPSSPPPARAAEISTMPQPREGGVESDASDGDFGENDDDRWRKAKRRKRKR